MSPNNLSENKYFKRGISLIIIMIITYLSVPILLIALAFFYSYKNNNNFAYSLKTVAAATGPLGDTLGGTMGPIVAIIAALLTYWAFMEQVKANKQQAEQFQKQFSDQKKGAFEARFFLLMDICNTKRKELNSSDINEDFFAYTLRYFKFHEEIYCATIYKWISSLGKKNHIFDNTNETLEERYQNFHSLIYVLAYPTIFGLIKPLSNNYHIEGKNDYFEALNETYLQKIDGHNTRLFRPEISINEIKVKLNEVSHFGGGIYRNMFPYLESLRLLLSYISNSYSNKTIDSNDMDFFYSILNNEINENEVLFLFIFQLMKEQEYPFFSSSAIEHSKIFHKIDMNKLHSLFSFSNLIPFSSIEEYYANR